MQTGTSKRATRDRLKAHLAKRRITYPRRAPLHVLRKTVRIVKQLERGEAYWRLRGKRMHYDRTLISIPVGHRWRLLARDVQGEVIPVCLLSHEAYNGIHKRR